MLTYLIFYLPRFAQIPDNCGIYGKELLRFANIYCEIWLLTA